MVVDVLHKEFIGPETARTFGEQLSSLLGAGEKRLIMDFSRTRMISSTVFGALMTFRKQVAAAGGTLMICGLNDAVRIGADISGLGSFIPIFEDRASALAAFAEEK